MYNGKMSHHPSDRKSRQARAERTLSLTREFLRRGEIGPAGCTPVIEMLKLSHQGAGFELSQEPGFAQKVGLGLPDDTGVLIFGSSTKPGGGWLNGAKAQEEDISLASTWGEQARLGGEGFYQARGGLGGAGPDRILHAGGLWLFDEHGVPLIKPKPVRFVSIAAPNLGNPETAALGTTVQVKMLARRLATALEHWHSSGTPHVLLGPIGCGVFKWNPEHSAAALGMALSNHKRAYGTVMPITLSMPDSVMGAVFDRVLANPAQWTNETLRKNVVKPKI